MFTQLIGLVVLIFIIYGVYKIIKYICYVFTSSGKAIVNRNDTKNVDGLFYTLNAAVIISTIISYNLMIPILSFPLGKYVIGPFPKTIIAIILFFTVRSFLNKRLGYPYELAYKEEEISKAITGIGGLLIIFFILINGMLQGGLYRAIEMIIRGW